MRTLGVYPVYPVHLVMVEVVKYKLVDSDRVLTDGFPDIGQQNTNKVTFHFLFPTLRFK